MTEIVWTPDGEQIIFSVNSMVDDTTVTTIYAIRVDGTDMRQLYQGSDVMRFILAGPDHILVENGATGRVDVVWLSHATMQTLNVPGLRLDQPMRGISWQGKE